MNGFKKTVLAATAALVLGFGANAHALLTIDVNGNTFNDGGSGFATTAGFDFNGWLINVNAFTMPGELLDTHATLESLGTGPALPLVITITEDAQVGPILGFASTSWTPTTIVNTDVTFESFVDGMPILNSGVVSVGGPMITDTAAINTGNPYTIVHRYTINPTGSGVSTVSGDSITNTAVPEPGTMLLMGSGLLGLGLWRKFKK